MALQPGARLGPYEIQVPLGSGGMGEVYRARDPRLSREVAVKVLTASATAGGDRLRRFEQEARAAGGLNHPNIVAIYDVGSHEGTPYVVSELLEGETLRERIGNGPMSPRRTMDCAVQMALGLAAAHERGIVHRDLKPENVFLTRDGRVKILDFGLAKLTGAEPTAPVSEDATAALGASPSPGSEPGLVLGTVGYMSPEQVRAQAVDHRSDIFSFGAILYEMLTGRRAFKGDTAVETMTAILKEEPPELSGSGPSLPAGFERVVRHCLEKSPDERFQSARDLAFNLQALSGLSGLSGAALFLPVPKGKAWLWPAVAGAAALVIAGLGLAAGRATARQPQPAFQLLTFQRGAVLSARFAPDGQTVVYAAAWNGGPFQIFMAHPGSPESRALGLVDASLFAISPAGEMALSLKHRFRGGFQFAGTLARAPLAGGVPREVLEGVYDASWSPDGGALAVVRSEAGRDRLEFPAGTVLYETAGWISHPRVSPSGRQIAFLDHPRWPDDGGSLAVVDLGGRRTTVTEGWYSLQGLAWSADGRELWFTGSSAGKARALHAVAVGGRPRLILRTPGALTLQDVARDGRLLLTRDSVRFEIAGRGPGEPAERDLSWLDGSMVEDLSRDGRTLLFYEGGEAGGTGYGVYVRGTDGSPAVRLGDGLASELSPDGKWALTIQRGSQPQLVLLPTGAGEPRPLPRGALTDLLSGHWLPDGRRLIVNGAEPGHGLRSYLQDLEGGAPQAVTPEGVWTQLISRDGSWLAAGGGPGQHLALHPLAGGAARPIPGTEPGDRAVQWTSDGGGLYVFRRDEIPCRLYRLDLARNRREVLRQLMPADPAGVVATHEVEITPDGRAYAYSYIRMLSELYLLEAPR
jgi:Tol biopolymer transport system component